MKLYEIAPALRFALDDIVVDEETGEILSSDALHAVEAQAAEKIEATALYLRELDAEAKAAKEEADRMLARVKSMQKRSDLSLIHISEPTARRRPFRSTRSRRSPRPSRRRRSRSARTRCSSRKPFPPAAASPAVN